MGKLPRELQSLIDESGALNREFGDAELRKRNARFDRQFTVAERRAETVVALAVGALVILAVASVVIRRFI